MNYYIQGDAANADKINAAFEKLGYDTSRHLFNAESVLYFTLNGEIRATTCNCAPAIIKTHPDYNELELPVQPKFKVGDWIVRNNGSSDIPIQVYGLKNDRYLVTNMLGSKGEVMLTCQDKWHLWTIEDAKDGDVLFKKSAGAFIYNGYSCEGICPGSHCGINTSGRFQTGYEHHWAVGKVYPATKKQRDLLFHKMKEEGYEWDADKKELKKFPKHYDISNFKPFDKVLVRQNDSSTWGISFLGCYSGGMFMCCSNVWYEQCIPFEGNEHLLGTTDMCDKQYINW